MSNYARFVSYLYEYKNGTKTENRGFVKVEVRDNICKMEIHIKSSSQPAGVPLTIYGFMHDNGRLPGIQLGSCSSGKGSTTCKLQFGTAQLGNSNYTFEDLSGLLIFCDNSICFGTSWDDNPISIDDFYPQQPAAEAPAQPEQSAPPATPVPPAMPESPTLLQEPGPVMEQPEMNRPMDEYDDEADEWAPENNYFNSREDIQAASTATLAAPDARWQELRLAYNSIDPFQDGEISECIKLDLNDLPDLQRNDWAIGSNQFIMHSYANYNHLILGKCDNSDESSYILGVPGSYDQKEKFMANMFGFNYFKPATSEETDVQNFGYWYRHIN